VILGIGQNVYIRNLSISGSSFGARTIGPADNGLVWIDLNMLGQHIPQMYRIADLRGINKRIASEVGLCPDCLGYGTNDPLPRAMHLQPVGSDELENPCVKCRGSGKEFIRTEVIRTAEEVTGSLVILPHEYLGNRRRTELCWRCSISPADHDQEILKNFPSPDVE
jgi:hypothetical protein